MSKPRILILDVETLPNVLTTWTLRPPKFLPYQAILRERHLACAAWKWLGERTVHTVRMGSMKAAMPDLPILKALVREINKADAVVAQNGDKFDLPWLRARLVKADLPPFKPVVQIDTLKILYQNYYLNSYKLDYVAQFFGFGGKRKIDPDLWMKVLKEEPGALDEMVKYNAKDVRILEKVYLRIRADAPAKLNHALFAGDKSDRVCPACGEEDLEKRGVALTRVNKRQRFQCRSCGHWSSKPLKSKIVR